jgi:asparagine synthase (glutamine-hydrolysing)
MCGIIGGYSKILNREISEKMRDTLKNRGMDDCGLFFDERKNIFLGHRRLSIIDLSEKAKQPMNISDKKGNNLVISYNGEVYNFEEIRKELEKKGYSFKSNSDTEIVLNSYLEWGKECVEKFKGMFAFAIFDYKKNKFLLFRDRFGVKPLYYYFNNSDFLFSSQLKGILEFPNFKKELNFSALSFYFQFGYIPAPLCIFKNVYKLESGCILEISLSDLKIKKEKYWYSEKYFSVEKTKKNKKELMIELEEILMKSFDYRMKADVDVGIFLSGGIDSSLITTLLSKNYHNLKTFTIGFENKEYDEAEHAKKIAKFLGTEHYQYYYSENDFLGMADIFGNAFDEPFGDISAFPTLFLSKFAKEKVKVSLSGDGGDEMFLGYDKYFALNKWMKYPHSIKTIGKNILNSLGTNTFGRVYSFLSKTLPLLPNYSNFRSKLLKLANLPENEGLQGIFQSSGSYWKASEVKEILGKNFSFSIDNFFKEEDFDNFSQMQLWDIKNYLEGDILVKTDRASMFYGLEAREPFLDEKILEFAGKLPNRLKYNKGKGKYILRELLSKNLPKKLFNRPKQGFTPPIEKWVDNNIVGGYLDLSKIKKQGILNIDTIGKFLAEEKNSKNGGYNKKWILTAFQIWAEKWL